MILEIADFRIVPGREAGFEEAMARATASVLARAKGMQGWKLNRGVENRGRYVLMIVWDTLEDHTVGFRGGPLFAEWRGLIGPYFASPPVVEHFDLVGQS